MPAPAIVPVTRSLRGVITMGASCPAARIGGGFMHRRARAPGAEYASFLQRIRRRADAGGRHDGDDRGDLYFE